jgi:dTDP-4-dehydrorhamnose reductase
LPARTQIVVLGGTGQLGTALVHELDRRGRVRADPARDVLDLLAIDRLHATLAALSPGAVINAAAYNDVSRAETPPHDAAAYRLNRDAPAALARSCAALGIPFIHVSTDYVFDGEKGAPYHEEDRASPLQVYGRTKHEGERAVLAAHEGALVARTSTLFGASRRDSPNFVRGVLENARRSGALQVVRAPVSSPTYAADLAAALLDLLDAGATGLVHVANAGSCSRLELAREAVRASGIGVEVRERASPPDGVPRPAYSVLDTGRLRRILGRPMRPWEEGLREYLS